MEDDDTEVTFERNPKTAKSHAKSTYEMQRGGDTEVTLKRNPKTDGPPRATQRTNMRCSVCCVMRCMTHAIKLSKLCPEV